MDHIWKNCKGYANKKVKHVSLLFMDPTRQRLVLDIEKLAKVAKHDFPDLDKLTIVVEVGGISQALNQIGIGFDVPINLVLPKGYSEQIEYK